MHTRSQIIKNQKHFLYEIKKWLKRDFSSSQKELTNISTNDQVIIEAKKGLESRFQKINIEKEIKNFFINEINIYPKFYAWWDKNEEKVEIFLYESK
tara:strand:+ start:264 stop:554 length:291 start_codon:yes stop_codon:yes gene_type:complete